MQTPGGDENDIASVPCAVDFQLEWNKHDRLFLGNFYMKSREIHSSGVVVISRTGD